MLIGEIQSIESTSYKTIKTGYKKPFFRASISEKNAPLKKENSHNFITG